MSVNYFLFYLIGIFCQDRNIGLLDGNSDQLSNFRIQRRQYKEASVLLRQNRIAVIHAPFLANQIKAGLKFLHDLLFKQRVKMR